MHRRYVMNVKVCVSSICCLHLVTKIITGFSGEVFFSKEACCNIGVVPGPVATKLVSIVVHVLNTIELPHQRDYVPGRHNLIHDNGSISSLIPVRSRLVGVTVAVVFNVHHELRFCRKSLS